MESEIVESKTRIMITEKEKNALLAALRICRGDYSNAYKGWKGEEPLDSLLEIVEDIQLKCAEPWHPMQTSGVNVGELLFNREQKGLFVEVLLFYIGGYPDEYKGADFFRKEATRLIYKLAVS